MSDNPYMMENTPEEEQRVKEVAARRHKEELTRLLEQFPSVRWSSSDVVDEGWGWA